MNHRPLNLLPVSILLLLFACEEREISVSRDLGYDFEILESEIDNSSFLISQSIDIGGDEFEEFEILAAAINSLSYSISGVDNPEAFDTWFFIAGNSSLNASFNSTPSPIVNVVEPVVFWTQEDGFLVNEFFEDNPNMTAFISEWESAIRTKTPYDVTILGEAIIGDDFTVTIHVDVTCTASE